MSGKQKSIMHETSTVGGLGEYLTGAGTAYDYLYRTKTELPPVSALGTEREIFRDFIYNKHLGHGLAYSDICDSNDRVEMNDNNPEMDDFVDVTLNQTVKVLEKNRSNDYIPIRLKTKNPGIIAHALVSPTTGEMKVLFRGTSDLQTAFADLEIGGPGAESFAEDMNSLIEQTNALVHQYGIKKIVCTGHSLGGALAEQFEQSLIDARAQNLGFPANERFHIQAANREHLSQLTDISGYFYNGAGVSKMVEARNQQALRFLKANDPSVKISGHYFRVKGDMVQQTSESHIFANVSPNDALVSMVVLDNGQEGSVLRTGAAATAVGALAGGAIGTFLGGPVGTYAGACTGAKLAGGVGTIVRAASSAKATHCNGYFTQQTGVQKIGYTIATNETPAGRAMIQQELATKSIALNNPVTQVVQKGLVKTVRQGCGFMSSIGAAVSSLPLLFSSNAKAATAPLVAKPVLAPAVVPAAPVQKRSSWWPF